MAADKQLTGLCGEHYVAALLAGYDLVVALPRGGAARADLFVADSKRGRALRVQVKSGRQAYYKYKDKFDGQVCYSWDTDLAIIDLHDEGLWYAFVSLANWPDIAEAPAVFFVPSAFVAERMKNEASSTRPRFWGFESDLEPYRGSSGILLLKASLSGSPLPIETN